MILVGPPDINIKEPRVEVLESELGIHQTTNRNSEYRAVQSSVAQDIRNLKLILGTCNDEHMTVMAWLIERAGSYITVNLDGSSYTAYLDAPIVTLRNDGATYDVTVILIIQDYDVLGTEGFDIISDEGGIWISV